MGFTPTFELAIRRQDDWPAFAADLVFGMPLFHDGTLTVAGEATTCWARLAELVHPAPPPVALRCQQLFGQPAGALAVTPFFDLLVVHAWGQAVHRQAQGSFPREWRSALVATLALPAYVAAEEPAARDLLEAFPEASAPLPATPVTHRTLEAFERRSLDVGPTPYGWYPAQVHAQARRMYDADGVAALQRLGTAFLLPDAQLQERLTHEGGAAAGQVIATWPTDDGD